jgi:hypothetical protein
MALVKYNNNSISAITAAAAIPAGAMTLIKEQTASSSSTISFVNGTSDVVISSTYPIYLFKFIGLHPANNGDYFQFNLSTDTGSNYNVTKTTTMFYTYHNEGDSTTALAYDTGTDLAQSTAFQQIALSVGNDNDQAFSGELWLFNPSSTTFVKHFMSKVSCSHSDDANNVQFMSGYGNTTSAVDAVQFKYQGANMDAGTIKLYGIKDS